MGGYSHALALYQKHSEGRSPRTLALQQFCSAHPYTMDAGHVLLHERKP